MEVEHTCPHCGHGIGRLVRFDGKGVPNCAKCHKSDWSQRFPFPESDAHRARRKAREAHLEQVSRDSLSLSDDPTDDEPADVEAADRTAPTPSERGECEQEELVRRIRDEESAKWAKGVAIGFLALLILLVWTRADRDERRRHDGPTCQYVGRSTQCW